MYKEEETKIKKKLRIQKKKRRHQSCIHLFNVNPIWVVIVTSDFCMFQPLKIWLKSDSLIPLLRLLHNDLKVTRLRATSLMIFKTFNQNCQSFCTFDYAILFSVVNDDFQICSFLEPDLVKYYMKPCDNFCYLIIWFYSLSLLWTNMILSVSKLLMLRYLLLLLLYMFIVCLLSIAIYSWFQKMATLNLLRVLFLYLMKMERQANIVVRRPKV